MRHRRCSGRTSRTCLSTACCSRLLQRLWAGTGASGRGCSITQVSVRDNDWVVVVLQFVQGSRAGKLQCFIVDELVGVQDRRRGRFRLTLQRGRRGCCSPIGVCRLSASRLCAGTSGPRKLRSLVRLIESATQVLNSCRGESTKAEDVKVSITVAVYLCMDAQAYLLSETSTPRPELAATSPPPDGRASKNPLTSSTAFCKKLILLM